MAIVTFSYLDSLSSSELLDLSKRYAKTKKKADPSKPLSKHQDDIAIRLGYKNWSLLHKHLDAITWTGFYKLKALALRTPGLGSFLKTYAVRTIEEDVAIDVMETWARAKYTPLIDFAYYDNESENGFGWPSVEMNEELEAEFEGRFPRELIERVGFGLDADEGPWGLEHTPQDDD